MKVLAKVFELGPVISGTSSNGTDWEKQTTVLEVQTLEPYQLAVEFMGERYTKQTKKLQVGQLVEVDFRIRCNKFEDKWFTRLDGFRLNVLAPQESNSQQNVTEEEPPF